MFLPSLITAIILAFLVLIYIKKFRWAGLIVGSILLIATSVSIYQTITEDPYQLAWLCNYTALFSLFLLLSFNQYMYDVAFLLACHAATVPLFDPNNSYIPTTAFFILAYLLKHLLPLFACIYLIRFKNCKITSKAFKRVIIFLVGYFVLMIFYNLTFDQNILEMMNPTTVLKYLGPWPIYNFVNAVLAVIFFYIIFSICKKCNLVKVTNR